MKTALRVRIGDLWLSLPLAFLVWFSFLRRVGLTDFWWHLKAGQIIVTTKSIPRVDLFSFTCAGKPFILQNWLVEILYYVTYHTGGLALVVALNTALLVVAFVPVYHLCYRAAAARVRVAVFSAFLAIGSLLSFSNVRSQVFSFVCFSATYWMLSAYRFHRRNVLWIIPLLMIPWVNLHGAFILGLGLMGLVLGSEAIRRLVLGARADTLSPSELRQLTYVLVLAVVATLVNPEDWRAYSSVTAVTRDPVSQSFVTEWQPPRFDQLGVLGFYGPFFLTLLVLLYASARPDFTELALFMGFAVFALTAVRNAIWFSLVAAPIMARYLPTIDITAVSEGLRRFPRIDRLVRRAHGRRESARHAPVRYGLNASIAALMLAITVALSPWVRPHLIAEGSGVFWDPKTPVRAVDYMETHGIREKMFTPQIYGDYLIWRLWPKQRTFVDGRVHLFQACPAVVDDYNMMFIDTQWEQRLERYGVRYVLLDKEENGSGTMMEGARTSSRWRVLYEDELSVLFERLAEDPYARGL